MTSGRPCNADKGKVKNFMQLSLIRHFVLEWPRREALDVCNEELPGAVWIDSVATAD